MGVQEILRANAVELCFEVFGDREDPPILLIAGATCSMDWWEEAFCQRLAAGRRCVIRYDNRDTGRSTSHAAGAPSYGVSDLAMDAAALLDAVAGGRANIVGVSLGAGIAQRLAVEEPLRVSTLTLISGTPGGPGGPIGAGLPPMSAELRSRFAHQADTPDWTDREAALATLLASRRAFAGERGIDEHHVRRVAARSLARTRDIAATMTNHWLLPGGGSIRSRLAEIAAPTLVLHGTADPLFPYGHAEALGREIPGARLVALPGMGHEMPPRSHWEVVVAAILQLTSGRAGASAVPNGRGQADGDGVR